MALFEYLRNQARPKETSQTGPAAASEAEEGTGEITPEGEALRAQLERLKSLTIFQWLEESSAEWAQADQHAPPTSETTPAIARGMMFEVLPFDHAATIAQMSMFLLAWKSGSEQVLAFARCTGCGYPVTILGGLSSSDAVRTCPKCRGPLESRRLVYSREVGAALRQEILPAHGRCITAHKAVESCLESNAVNELEQRIGDLLKLARQENHRPAIARGEEQERLLQFLRLVLVAEPIVKVACSADEQSQSALGKLLEAMDAMKNAAADPSQVSSGNNARPAANRLVAEAERQVRELSEFGCQQLAACPTAVGITAVQTAVRLWRMLIEKYPSQISLRYGLACDLDQLGLGLRVTAPNRRLEALELVREASELLTTLDREDPAGQTERTPLRESIAQHLREKW